MSSIDYKQVLRTGYDAKAQELLIKKLDARVDSGSVFPIAEEDINKSFPIRVNEATGRRMRFSYLNRLFRKM